VTAARIDALLAAARARLERVEPADLDAAVTAGALVVDIRPEVNRREEGEIPGAIVIDRNVLEWRLDPTSGHELPVAHEGRRVVLVCNEGYASSLAAATLQDLGLAGATDLAGGYRAWREHAATDGGATSPPA
jgi:rhodanese-related sulfurtransferase